MSVALDNPGSPILGTARSLVCSFDPMGLTTAVSWTKNGVAVNTSDSGVTVSTVAGSNSTLTFNPLRASDGAMYECIVMVNSSECTVSAPFSLSVIGE